MEANKEITVEEIWDKHFSKGDFFCHLDMDQIAISDAFEEYANAKLHLLQQEYYNLKGQHESLEKQAIKQNDILFEFQQEYDKLKVEHDIELKINLRLSERVYYLKQEHAALKEKAEKMLTAITSTLFDLNNNINPMLLKMGMHPLTLMVTELTEALSSYNSQTNNQNENNG